MSRAAVVVPAYNGFEHLGRCLDALERHTGAEHHVILVDDASTDPRVLPLLRALAARRANTRLIENAANLGFVGSVNGALAQLDGDVVVLNADTVVTSGWIDALERCRASDPRIGIACPLSNNATLVSVTGITPLFDADDHEAIAACVRCAGPPTYPRLPTAAGFCMLLTRELLAAAGPFDPAYGRGYGEENDLSMRALGLGFEIACCDDTYVHHAGEASFGEVEGIGSARERNRRLLERRWPAYRPGVSAWMRANPLRGRIERINAECERDRMPGRPRVLHVVHSFDSPGGVELHTRAIIDGLRDEVAFNVAVARGPHGLWADFVQERPQANLRVSRLNQDLLTNGVRVLEFAASVRDASVERAFAALLEGGYDVVHFHSPLGWNSLRLPELARESGARVVLSVHDMGWMCAEYNMVTGEDDHPCGKTLARAERDCINCLRGKSFTTSVQAENSIGLFLEDRFAAATSAIGAAHVILCPSRYAATRVTGAFGPEVAKKLRVIGHGVEPLPHIHRPASGGPLRVAFVGRFTSRKGAHHFIEAARGLRGQGIEFEAWGMLDRRFEGPAREAGVAVRGPYEVRELPRHLANVDLVMMPSTLEETFCLSLSEVHAIGIPVAASRIGALAERIVEGHNGFLYDVGDVATMRRQLLRMRDNRDLLARTAQVIAAERPKSIEANAGEYRELYRELASAASHRGQGGAPVPIPMEVFIPREKRSRTPLGDAQYDQWLRAEVLASPAADAKPMAIVRLAAGAAESELPVAQLNRMVEACATEWVAIAQAGDVVEADALSALADEAMRRPGAALLYCDHDSMSHRGERYDSAFKPAFSRELLCHVPYIAGLCAIHRARWLAMGGFRSSGWLGLVEFALRLADPRAIVHVPRLLVHRLDSNALWLDDPAWRARMAEVVGALLRQSGERAMHLPASADAPAMWAHAPSPAAPISVLLRAHPAGDAAKCREALLQGTRARIGEIFDEGTALAEAFARSRHDRLAIVDTRCRRFAPGWIERLEQGMTASTAAIGADVIDAAGRRVAGGEITGGGPWAVAGAAPPAQGSDTQSAFLLNPRDVSCVSPFISLWNRDAIAKDPALAEAFGAGEFDIAHVCLRSRERGFSVLARPIVAAELAAAALASFPLHGGDGVPSSVIWMRERWRDALARDPFHHPMLALAGPRAAPAPRFSTPRDSGVLRVCAFPFDRWASGEMRVRQPCRALEDAGLAEALIMSTHESGHAPNYLEWARLGAGTLLAHNFFHDYQLLSLAEIARSSRSLRVLGMDDLLTALPPGNPYAQTIYPDLAMRIAKAVSMCDRFVVSTPAIAQAYGRGAPEVIVIPNTLDPVAWAGLENAPRGGERPRVGWAGARQHLDDLRVLEPVVEATAHEIDWVFFGMCPPELRRHAREVHDMVPIARYPAKLASLGLDAAVAPLVDHPFNRAKSALKVLEYGAVGIPTIASDIPAYRATPATVVAEAPSDWIEAVRALVLSREYAREQGLLLRDWVRANAMISSTLAAWRRAFAREG